MMAGVTTCNFGKVPESIRKEHPESYSQQLRRLVTHPGTKLHPATGKFTKKKSFQFTPKRSFYSRQEFGPPKFEALDFQHGASSSCHPSVK